MHAPSPAQESFPLGPFNPPRLWIGLWQLSSTAWGTAPASKIREAMRRHVDQGYTAFGKNNPGIFSLLSLSLVLPFPKHGESSQHPPLSSLSFPLTDVIASRRPPQLPKGEFPRDRVQSQCQPQTLISTLPADHYGPAEIVFVSLATFTLGSSVPVTDAHPNPAIPTGAIPGAPPTTHRSRRHQMVCLQTRRRTLSHHRRGRRPRAHDKNANRSP